MRLAVHPADLRRRAPVHAIPDRSHTFCLLRRPVGWPQIGAIARVVTLRRSRRADPCAGGAGRRRGNCQTVALRDWVHRFNGSGLEGLVDNWTEGPKPRLSAEQLAQFAQIVEAGPDREKDGVVRWRRLDLKRVIAERFGVDFHPRYVGKLLKKLGFSHISARPRHPAQDERTVEAFKKTSRAR